VVAHSPVCSITLCTFPSLLPDWVSWHHAHCAIRAAGHGFILYWRAVMTPLMTTAAERRPCTAYLMGCPTIAEKICRHDRAVMFCAPLRALIYIDPGDRTRFAAGHPGTVFAGFADQTIAELGTGLDHQFAELLKALGVGTTEGLRTAGLAGHRSVDANPPQPVRLRPDAGPRSL